MLFEFRSGKLKKVSQEGDGGSTPEGRVRRQTSEEGDDGGDEQTIPPPQNLQSWTWLWHDLTTFAPYDAELAHKDLTLPPNISSASTNTAATTTASTVGGEVTESAAQHVFASVTAKSQKVFSLLGTRQLRAIEDEGVVRVSAEGMTKYGVQYDALLAAARDEFVAANDAALRGLLAEFRDHGMVLAKEAEGEAREVLWIPASQDVLKTILGYLNK